jgi:GT2 family glycosyltransferase
MAFAAFIITYERADILVNTIQKIFEQTVSPQKLLIVDNSISLETQDLIATWIDPRLEYYRVGYNAGPAGAANIALQRLSTQGYDWIYWGDDNDPPRFTDCFEVLLNSVTRNTGAIGAVGSLFNWKTGLRERYPDDHLKGLLPVDAIGGGFCFIINAKAIDKETVPDPELYFGLEEFDFCQKLKRKGFDVYVVGELLYRYREQSKKLGIEKKASIIPRRSLTTLHRDYYSYRNGIYLMFYVFKKYHLVAVYTIRCLAKIPFGFAKGLKFGLKNATLLTLAICHGLMKKMGRTF